MTTIAHRSNNSDKAAWAQRLLAGAGVLILAFLAAFLAVGAEIGGLADPAIHPVTFIAGLIAVTVVLTWWATEGDRRIFFIIIVTMALKITGTYLRIVLLSSVGDARFYNWAGARVSDWLAEGFFLPDDPRVSFRSRSSSNLVYVVGWIYHLAGKSLVVAYSFFSFLSFAGCLFVYRAASRAVPQLDRLRLALLLFCMPSMLFWPSTLGKDAWMVFAIGVVSLGVSGIVRSGSLWGIGLAAAGIAMAGWIRPHVAAALTLAFLVALVWPQRSVRGGRPLKIVIAIVGVMLIGSMAALVQEYLGTKDRFDFGSVLNQTEETTAQGGSEFVTRPIRDPLGFVIGVPSVLLRPFPHETTTIPQLATSFEGVAVLALFVLSRKRIVRAISLFRTNGFIRFAWLYFGGFIIAFSAVSNFGILARQRSQMWPLLLVLLAVATSTKATVEPTEASSAQELSLP